MQAFVRLPPEFDNLLLNAAGYFLVSPLNRFLAVGDICSLYIAANFYLLLLSSGSPHKSMGERGRGEYEPVS